MGRYEEPTRDDDWLYKLLLKTRGDRRPEGRRLLRTRIYDGNGMHYTTIYAVEGSPPHGRAIICKDEPWIYIIDTNHQTKIGNWYGPRVLKRHVEKFEMLPAGQRDDYELVDREVRVH
jgi:hypothetical protein